MPSNEGVFGYSLDDLRQAAGALTGAGLDAGLPPLTRFLGTCASIATTRLLDKNGSEPHLPVAFILGEYADFGDGWSNPNRYLAEGTSTLSGRIWVGNASLLDARHIKHDAAAEDIDEFLVSLGAGELPTVVCFLGSPAQGLHFYPAGVDGAVHEVFPLRASLTLTEAEVEDFIDEFHDEHLAIPSIQSFSTWEAPDKYWARANAEMTIQKQLRIAFNNAFPGFKAVPEEKNPMGRTDLTLAAVSPSFGRRNLGLLELKVLRSKGETGRPYSPEFHQSWLRSGVDQAYSYATRLVGDPWKMLCCFDMRESPIVSVMSPHARVAAKLKVSLKHWPLYNSAPARQTAVAAAELSRLKD